jgi:hypothetical protein
MTRQKKQKVYLAVLGLAVVAFVMDRTLLDASTTAPASATAALRSRQAKKAQDAKQPGPEDDSAPQAPVKTDLSRRVSIGRQIARICIDEASASAGPCPDAFTASPLWVAVEVEQDPQEQVSKDKTVLESLKSRYTLTAVISGSSGMAILGGRCVRLGQSIEGCTLVEVTGQRAIFQAGEHRVELKVPQ